MTQPKQPITFHGPTNVMIGQQIKELRKAAKLTQRELSATLQWGHSTLSNYETGRRPITVEQLVTIARALKLPSIYPLLGASPTAALLMAYISTASEAECEQVVFVIQTLRDDLPLPPFDDETTVPASPHNRSSIGMDDL